MRIPWLALAATVASVQSASWIDADGNSFNGQCTPGKRFFLGKTVVGECNESNGISVTGNFHKRCSVPKFQSLSK